MSTKSTNPEFDEKFWREAIQGRDYYRSEIGFESYRFAIEYGQVARANRGEEATFEQIEADLQKEWASFAPDARISWEQARGAVADAFKNSTKRADAIAQRGDFAKPPTFGEQGENVPRNLDEPNR